MDKQHKLLQEPVVQADQYESPLIVAEMVERSYWHSGVSMFAQTNAIVNAIMTPILDVANVPIPLRQAFYGPVEEHLVELFSRGTGKVTDRDIDHLISKCRNSLPTIDKAQRAFEKSGILHIASKGFWAQGYLYHLGEPQFIARKEPDIIQSLTYLLDHTSHLDTAVRDRTRMLTHTITEWGKSRHYRSARELSLPVVTPGSTYFGRNDVVLFRKSNPPIVIEIDSQPNGRSQPKLEFAYKAGALPVWVRWNLGEAESPPRGVAVIDLCDR